MTREHFLSFTKFRKNLLLIMMVFLPAPVLLAQLPAKVEKALDDYYSEIVKVYMIIELMDTDGELIVSLWGSEEMGYTDVTNADGPGGFVNGRIVGECIDDNSDSEATIRITADFKVGHIEY